MNINLPNYTGPYRSDGKFQSSVAFGTTSPKDKLDALSRLHDSAYANYKDYGHRVAADKIYNTEAKKLVGIFPELARDLVLYGNQTGRSISNLVSGYRYGPIGFVAGAVKNMYNLNDYMINESKYAKDVSEYYLTDPSAEKLVGVNSRAENALHPTDDDVVYNLESSDPLIESQPSALEQSGQGGLRNGFNVPKRRRRRRCYNPYC